MPTTIVDDVIRGPFILSMAKGLSLSLLTYDYYLPLDRRTLYVKILHINIKLHANLQIIYD